MQRVNKDRSLRKSERNGLFDWRMIELPFRSPLAGQPRNMAKLLANNFKNLLAEQYQVAAGSGGSAPAGAACSSVSRRR